MDGAPWREALAEAGLLALFMVAACALAVALDHPDAAGMSMNPARSLGPALVAGEPGALWVYLVAPPLGMLSAASALRRRLAGRGCAKLRHAPEVPCRFCGQRPVLRRER